MKTTSKIIGATIAASVALAATFIKPQETPGGIPVPPYLDIGGVPTDCFGNTYDVHLGVTRTTKECDEVLNKDLYNRAEKISHVLDPYPNPTSAAAFISLAYNCGTGLFAKSQIPKLWNSGQHIRACEHIKKICTTAKGKFILGLQKRRIKESELCLSGLRQQQ